MDNKDQFQIKHNQRPRKIIEDSPNLLVELHARKNEIIFNTIDEDESVSFNLTIQQRTSPAIYIYCFKPYFLNAIQLHLF